MRIISGKNRGMKLFSPENLFTRPTEDRIKEAIFDILFQVKPEAVVLDLFAATGNIGLEFLSRGAGHVVFGELRKDNVSILKKNIAKTGYPNDSEVILGDFSRVLIQIGNRNMKFDYIFIDPPYEMTEYYKKSLDLIEEYGLLSENGIVIVESRESLSETILNKWDVFKDKKYGKNHRVYFMRKKIGQD